MTSPRTRVPPRHALALVVAATALGCATPQRSAARGPAVQVLSDGTQIVCAMERPTGSHISAEVCRRVVPADLGRARLQNELVKPKSAPLP